MPPDYDFQFDFTESESKNALGVNMGYYPPFRRLLHKPSLAEKPASSRMNQNLLSVHEVSL